MKGKQFRFLIVFAAIVVIGATLTACGDADIRALQSTTQRFAIGSDADQIVQEGKTSYAVFAPGQYTIDEDQPPVQKALLDFVNSGQYNIVRVETTYTETCLTSVRIDYRHDQLGGPGNKLRLKLVLQKTGYDGSCYFDDIHNAVVSQSESTANVQAVNTPVYNGYLVAGEIWYMTY